MPPTFKKVLIAPRCYEERHPHNDKPTGRYWARFPVNRRYTWKLLDCQTKREAIAAAQNATARRADTFATLADLYVQCGCPTRKQKFKRASDAFIAAEKRNTERLKNYFGPLSVTEVNDLLQIPKYAAWRLRQTGKGRGTRALDKEVQTLSNILNYAVFGTKQERFNFLQSNRPKYHTTRSHSRDRMPESANVVHRIADYFFSAADIDPRKLRLEVYGWMTLFQMFMGVRTSELLRLRLDAKAEEAGAIVNGWLHLGRRSKSGVNPYCQIGAEFGQMLQCFFHWHANRFPASKVYFPSADGTLIYSNAHVMELTKAARKLELPHVTPHGLRAYYVTKRRRDGAMDSHIAAEIGDKTVALISTTYGDTPGGKPLSWLPSEGLPAWHRWLPAAQKIARIA